MYVMKNVLNKMLIELIGMLSWAALRDRYLILVMCL